MKRSGLSTLCLALGAGVSFWGTLPTQVTAQKRQSFRHVSVEQGLSHGVVRDILQDRQGFIWIATEDGLNRYDGVNLKVFRREHGNPNSLSSSNFGKLIHPLSLALTRKTASTGIFDVLAALGRERSLERIAAALEWIVRERSAASSSTQSAP